MTVSRLIFSMRPVFSSMIFSIRRTTRARRPQYLSISPSNRSPCVASFSSSVEANPEIDAPVRPDSAQAKGPRRFRGPSKMVASQGLEPRTKGL